MFRRNGLFCSDAKLSPYAANSSTSLGILTHNELRPSATDVKDDTDGRRLLSGCDCKIGFQSSTRVHAELR